MPDNVVGVGLAKGILGLLLLAGCVAVSGGSESGTLSGTISIGPLCPVERNPPDPNCVPTQETFDAYAVKVVDASGRTVARVVGNAQQNGAFSIELPAGVYTLHATAGLGEFSERVTVASGQVTTQILSIDTGIR